MSCWLWLLLGLAVLLAVLLTSKIKLHLYYSRTKENDRLYMEFAVLYGVFRFRYDVPVIKFKSLLSGVYVKTEQINDGSSALVGDSTQNITFEQVKRMFERIPVMLRHTRGMMKWWKDTLRHVHCSELKWDTRIGIGDAAETAVAAGLIWSMKSSLLGFLLRRVRLDTKPRMQVTPQFNQHHFSMEFSCMLKIRVAAALATGFMLLLRIVKAGGLKTWYRVLSQS